jgi:hypothetical protein
LATALGDNEAIEDGTNLYVGTDVLSAFGMVLPSAEIVAHGAVANPPLHVVKFNGADFIASSATSFGDAQSASGSPTLTPVPEPGTLALLIAGVAAICGRRRRGT